VIVGLGIDVVDIARARSMLDAHGERVLRRVCTEAEAAYVRSHQSGAHRFAARLAAKEAAFKALAGSYEARSIGWKEIEVVLADEGPPWLVLHGRAADRARQLGMWRSWLSLTHSDLSAAATVILEGQGTNNSEEAR
jgi:holo-[acyl-carrier protein] synthase